MSPFREGGPTPEEMGINKMDNLSEELSGKLPNEEIEQVKEIPNADFLEREKLIGGLIDFFSSQEAEQLRRGIDTENNEQKVETLKVLIDKINELSVGEKQEKFRESTGVGIEGIGIEVKWAVDWQPPRPAEDIYQNYLNKATQLIESGKVQEAAAIIFQAVNLIHLYKDGNGRTARLAFLFLQNPEAVKNPAIVDAYLRRDYRRVQSRNVSEHNLNAALGELQESYGLKGNMPFMRFSDGTITKTGVNTELKILAYSLVYREKNKNNDMPLIIDYDRLPAEERKAVEGKEQALKKDILLTLLELPDERGLIIEKMGL